MQELFKLNLGHCHPQELTVCIKNRDCMIYQGGEHKGKFNKLFFHEIGHILWDNDGNHPECDIEQHSQEWKEKVTQLHKRYLEL